VDPELALVIDDDADQRAVTRLLLEHEGYDVIEAENGAEGLSLLDHVDPVVIVLDLQMPIVDGFEFLRARAAHGVAPHSSVVVCSGSDMGDVEPSCVCCAKPFARDTFLGAVREARRRTDSSVAAGA
jgi:CheY-like chemotaxis protein